MGHWGVVLRIGLIRALSESAFRMVMLGSSPVRDIVLCTSVALKIAPSPRHFLTAAHDAAVGGICRSGV